MRHLKLMQNDAPKRDERFYGYFEPATSRRLPIVKVVQGTRVVANRPLPFGTPAKPELADPELEDLGYRRVDGWRLVGNSYQCTVEPIFSDDVA